MKPEFLFAMVGNGTGRITAGFLISCLRALRTRNIEIAYVSDGPYVGRARNTVATYFLLNTDIPYLVFIDMDMNYTSNDLAMLFESDEEIVGGVYFIKSADTIQPAAVRFENRDYPDVPGRIEVKRAGTGFMRIHRSVFDKLYSAPSLILPNKKFPTAERYNDYQGNPQWNFFPMPITDDELLPEDWGFCDLARGAGFKIMLDTRIQLLHEGSALYPLKK